MYWNCLRALEVLRIFRWCGCLILMYMRFMEATSPWIGRLMDLHHSYLLLSEGNSS